MNPKLELGEFARTSVKREKRAFRIMLLYCFFSAAGLIFFGMHELNFVIGITFAFLVLIGGYIVSERPYEKKACCPACGKKLVGRYGLLTAFQHCPNCDSELFEPSHSPAAFPNKTAFPATLSIFSGTILAAAVLFPICILFFWWIGIRLHGNPGAFPDSIQIIFQQIIMASAGIPVAAGLLLLVRKGLESRWKRCPVCGERFSPNIANALGNCNRCGTILLETLPVKPDTILPSRTLLVDCRRITNHFLSIVMLLPLIVMIVGDYFDHISLFVLTLLCSVLIAFTAGKIYEAKNGKKDGAEQTMSLLQGKDRHSVDTTMSALRQKNNQGGNGQMNRILLMDIKGKKANIIYLACVWVAVFVFENWSYTSWHWLRPSDARLDQTYFLCSWVTLTLLTVEFILNYPSDKLWPRIVSAVLALLVLGFALPTLQHSGNSQKSNTGKKY